MLCHKLQITPPWLVSQQPQLHHIQPKHAKDGTTLPVLCPIHPTPSPLDSDWLEEDWDGEIEKEKRKEKQRKEEEMKQRQEEKKNLDSNYYPPSPMYVPCYEEEPSALGRDLMPKLAPEKPRDMKQNEKRKQDGRGQKNSARTFKWGKGFRLLFRFRFGLWLSNLCVNRQEAS